MSVLIAETADADDSESWFESALRHAELAAHQIARLRNPCWNPAWRDLVADDTRPARAFSIRWGSRGKRSRPSTVDAAVRFAKAHAAAACSPATPFDFGSGSGSGASTSGGDEGSFSQEKMRRVRDAADVSGAAGGCETKMDFQAVRIDRAPVGFNVSSANDYRRAGKKKTFCELQEEEKLLLLEKHMLQKEMEMRKNGYDGLISENLRLKGQRISFRTGWRGRVPAKSATACASSSAPRSSACFVIPDLNEPLSENLD